MYAQETVAAAPQSIMGRVSQLRGALTETCAGRELMTELMPADIVRVGKGTVLDFSDWSQWDQWGQWQ